MWSPTHVKVTVCCARELLVKGKNGTNDVFVLIGLGKNQFRTSVKQKSAPNLVDWHEECELEIPSNQGNKAEISVTLFHHNFIGVDEFLGRVVLPLVDLDAYEQPKTRIYPLQSKAGQEHKVGRPRGNVELVVAFTVHTANWNDFATSQKTADRLSGSVGHLLSRNQSSHGGSLLSLGSKSVDKSNLLKKKLLTPLQFNKGKASKDSHSEGEEAAECGPIVESKIETVFKKDQVIVEDNEEEDQVKDEIANDSSIAVSPLRPAEGETHSEKTGEKLDIAAEGSREQDCEEAPFKDVCEEAAVADCEETAVSDRSEQVTFGNCEETATENCEETTVGNHEETAMKASDYWEETAVENGQETTVKDNCEEPEAEGGEGSATKEGEEIANEEREETATTENEGSTTKECEGSTAKEGEEIANEEREETTTKGNEGFTTKECEGSSTEECEESTIKECEGATAQDCEETANTVYWDDTAVEDGEECTSEDCEATVAECCGETAVKVDELSPPAVERGRARKEEIAAQDGEETQFLCQDISSVGVTDGMVADAARNSSTLDDADARCCSTQSEEWEENISCESDKCLALLQKNDEVVMKNDKNDMKDDPIIPTSSNEMTAVYTPYSHLPVEQLHSLLLKRDQQIQDLSDYIDSLLLRVLQFCPTLLNQSEPL